MINVNAQPNRHTETVPQGKTVAFCRCWHSGKFPYCDGTHKQLNAQGENVGPVVVTAGTAE
ncbi:MAG: CDGSH iron-sulfur domain-containing protein [Caldilineales bacterium]|nr:CDGSH iron-sulfur domain-containing protein [Caldilineales bacterium]MDW8317328.1 CDGSH iron-sulfur domain-containing protein [Anaerolineae bacterium]